MGMFERLFGDAARSGAVRVGTDCCQTILESFGWPYESHGVTTLTGVYLLMIVPSPT